MRATSSRTRTFLGAAAALLVSASLLSAGSVSAGAQEAPPPSGTVITTPDPVPDEYIVTLRGAPTGGDVTATADRVAARHDADVIDVYNHALHGFAARMSADHAKALAADPAVATVEQNGRMHVDTVTSPQSPTPSWGLDRIDQTDAISGPPPPSSYSFATTAPNVHVYVIDTGIRTDHNDFGGRASVGADFVGGAPCSTAVVQPADAGHATHVAGTIGGDMFGVAKSVQLVSVRVLDCNGSGKFDDVIAGIDWVTANAVRPAVANMSLGGSGSQAVDNAVQSSIASGITYSVSAGNSNVDACTQSPARVPAAITVGATTSTDARASFSNFGTCLDLFAPGASIISDWYTSASATATLSGTSMSSPHVAGAAALYLSAHPSATPAQVASAINSNALVNRVTSAGAGSPTLLLNTLCSDAPAAAQAPCPPVVTVTVGLGSVHLAWSTPVSPGSPLSGYTIGRGTTPGSEAPIATPGAGATSFDDTVPAGSTYYYKVSATNSSGTTTSTELSATPGPVLAVAPTRGGAHLTWTVPPGVTPPITGFWINRGTTAGTETQLPTQLGAGATSFDDSGLSSSQTYYYTISAISGGLKSSNEVSVTPSPIVAPGPPTLNGSASSSAAHLSWTPPADNGGMPITGYKVYRGTGACTDSALTVPPLPANQTSYDDGGLTDGTTYKYCVTALSSAGESAASSSVSVTPTAALDVAVRGGDNAVWWRHFDAGSWTNWTSLGGATNNDVTTVSGGGNLWVFAVGTDQALWFRRYNGSTWSAWTSFGGLVTTSPAAVYDGTKVRVFARGFDGAVYSASVTGASITQSWFGLGGVISGSPSAVWDGSGTVLVVRGGDNAAYRGRLTGATTWTGWIGLGGVISADPAAVLDGASVRAFVQGSDGGLYTTNLAAPVWVGLGGVLAARPAVTVTATGALRVFVRGSDNLLYTRVSGAGGGSTWPGGFEGLATATTTAPSATWNGVASVVSTRGSDGSVLVGTYAASWQGASSLGGVIVGSVSLSATP